MQRQVKPYSLFLLSCHAHAQVLFGHFLLLSGIFSKGIILTLIVVASGLHCQAQSDTSFQLKEVTVTRSRQQGFSSGVKLISIDSNVVQNYKNNNLSDLLRDQTTIYVKSYGLGALSTPSMRGGSAYHTAVLWNGFNIASTMNGNVDFSLIKNFLTDDISILYGGNSALSGSGAVSGTILLRNKANFGEGWSLRLGGTAGSFNAFQQNGAIKWSGKRWITSLRAFHETAKNNFPFFDPNTGERRLQLNNHLSQQGFLWENYFMTGKYSTWNFRYWYQHSNRQVPPTLLQTATAAQQLDVSHRITTEYKHTGYRFVSAARAAFFHEQLNYSDPDALQASLSSSNTLIGEAETKYSFSEKHQLNAGLNNTYTKAISTGYNGRPQQNRAAVFGSYRFQNHDQKLNVTISARQELVNKRFVPFTYSAGMNYAVSKSILLRLQGSKVFRFPTLNDLYWSPGGNSKLRPESGYSGEGGARLDAVKLLAPLLNPQSTFTQRFSCILDVTYFNKIISNWIIWMPSATYWSPQNIQKVDSRGIETSLDISYRFSKFTLGGNTKINYVRSINEQVTSEDDASLHRQLIYVPMYSTVSNIYISCRNFYFNYNHTYTGYRFTSNDNLAYLPPYSLSNLQLSKSIPFQKYLINLFVKANNIFNCQYQVMLSRPMPLRNYQAGISITFNQSKNNNNNN